MQPTALVIGHPDLEGWSLFPDLPGARQEAGKVAEVLSARSYQVFASIDEKADEILAALHRDAWRIVHFAGHGAHEFLLEEDTTAQPRRMSGMVIGKNIFLTPGDIAQMRWVPELVFINCCHLGRTDAEYTHDRVGLAANLGVEFIRMGARAVIAAGWAVGDDAALAFTETFYHELLAGQTFGDAVRAAREETWRRFRNVNTWGAYQCYGDQSFRLRANGQDGATKRAPYATASELVVDLDNIAAGLSVGSRSAAHLENTRARIDDVLGAIPPSQRECWLTRADVCAALGFVHGNLRDWDVAISWLEKALAGEGDCPLRAIEQAANFRIRRAAEKWLAIRGQLSATEQEEERARQRKAIESAIMDLDLLCKRGVTAERLNLLGSACKRLAIVQASDSEARAEALVNMANYYAQGFEREPANAYPFTNWATARLLNAHFSGDDGADDWRRKLSEGLVRLTQELGESNAVAPSFWSGAGLGDLELLQWLERSLASDASANAGAVPADAQDHIAAAEQMYLTVIRRGASPREVSSLAENVGFLIEMLREESPQLGAALATLRGRLL
jgi:hypothetical protein